MATPDIAAILAEIDHPMTAQVEMLRGLILEVDPRIEEGVKWNSLSFRTTEWFATLNKRALDRIEFVFHLGAKVRDADASGIPDPAGLLNWKSKDRCLIAFADAAAVDRDAEAFRAIVKQWIEHV